VVELPRPHGVGARAALLAAEFGSPQVGIIAGGGFTPLIPLGQSCVSVIRINLDLLRSQCVPDGCFSLAPAAFPGRGAGDRGVGASPVTRGQRPGTRYRGTLAALGAAGLSRFVNRVGTGRRRSGLMTAIGSVPAAPRGPAAGRPRALLHPGRARLSCAEPLGACSGAPLKTPPRPHVVRSMPSPPGSASGAPLVHLDILPRWFRRPGRECARLLICPLALACG